MPDLMDFTITALSSQTINNAPRVQLSGQVVSSDASQTVLADFTGANAIIFPQVLGQLSAAKRLEFVEMCAMWLLKERGLL